MENIIIKCSAIRRTCMPITNALCTKISQRNYIEHATQRSEREIHPYTKMHPWKSIEEFSNCLSSNIIYNKDGLVVLNKPYGIGHKKVKVQKVLHKIPNAMDYSLEDAIPHICKQLNYSELFVVQKPEKYMTGITILATDTKTAEAVKLANRRSNTFNRTYWIITTRVPKKLKGKERVAMKMLQNENFTYRKAAIVTSWGRNEEKRQDVKILNIEYEVLSNSTFNLCSLIELKSSTTRWHAIRLFAATFLYCPVLGDNLCASDIQKVGNTYVKVDPFLDITTLPPKLDKDLLNQLCIQPQRQAIIPVHIHLRSVVLPWFLGKQKDLVIEAPLIPPFEWTYKQLEFKKIIEHKYKL